MQFYLRIFSNAQAKITTFADAREEFGTLLTRENEGLLFKADLVFSDGPSETHMILGDSPTLLFPGQSDRRQGSADNLIFEYECLDADMLRELYEKFLAGGAKTNGALKRKIGCAG